VILDAHLLDEHIDSNERSAADLIFALAKDEGLSIFLPHSVKAEIDDPNTPAATRERASEFIYTMAVGEDPRSAARFELLLRGNAAPGRHSADARHLAVACRFGGGFFLTLDKRMLDREADIRLACPGLWVIRPTKLLDLMQINRQL
jgi:predicted nucleic acid-binding protein